MTVSLWLDNSFNTYIDFAALSKSRFGFASYPFTARRTRHQRGVISRRRLNIQGENFFRSPCRRNPSRPGF
jgi:hypothetical protein